MKTLTQLLVIPVLLLGISGCKEEPKPNYPDLKRIDKIYKQNIIAEPDGSMKTDSAQKSIRMLKAYSISENFYFTSIGQYQEFRKEQMEIE